MSEQEPLILIERLVAGLKQRKIPFCVWKSSTFLHQTLCGEGDLDLLIGKGYFKECRDLLTILGFVRGICRKDLKNADTRHFFGYDEISGKIVHVHLYNRLLVGDGHYPNYHLPVEDRYFETGELVEGIPLPPCELEFIVWVICLTLQRHPVPLLMRTICSVRLWSQLPSIVMGDNPLLAESDQARQCDLQQRCNLGKLQNRLAESFPWISPELFETCRKTLETGAPRFAALQAAWRLAAALRLLRIVHPLRSYWYLLSELWLTKWKTLLHRVGLPVALKRSLVTGGRLIAFVGADGAGKSTNIKQVRSLLEPFLNVGQCHFGKPRRGVAGFGADWFLKVARRVCGKRCQSWLSALGFYVTACHRRRAFVRARKLVSRGFCVLMDRFPLSGLRTMDCPRIRLMGEKGRFFEFLARREEALYRDLQADALIVLQIDLEQALLRRPDDDPVYLSRRVLEVITAIRDDEKAHVVDGGQPLSQVEAQVCLRVWYCLLNRPKVMELIGPPAVGKSSLVARLEQMVGNLETTIPQRQLRIRLLGTMFRRLPDLLIAMASGVGLVYVKRLLIAETVVTILEDRCLGRMCNGQDLLMDVGPVFHLAKAEKENKFRIDRWIRQINQRLADSLDCVVWLEASDTVLWQRLHQRSKQHSLKGKSVDETTAFCQEYRKAFGNVIERVDDRLSVVQIDTCKSGLEDTAGKIFGLLKKTAYESGSASPKIKTAP